ncbi:cell wall elongation regulator TseB-like domain-containing protein [Enterococcus sp. LJL98]
MNKVEENERKKVLLLFSSIVILLVMILFSAIFYIRASRPMRQAKAEAVAIAQEYVDFKRVDQFYWFTREATYFSLVGEQENGERVVVVIPKKGDQLLIFDEKDGLTEAQARGIIQERFPEEKVRKTTLGVFSDQVVWEVMTKMNEESHYYLLSFKEGELIKSIPPKE